MINKDAIWVGVIIGIIVPAVIYSIFLLGMDMANIRVSLIISEKMQLVLIAINAILLRQFMIKREQDNIGKGILIVTFIGVVIHTLHYYTDLF